MKVLKFGGSSVSDAYRIREVCRIISSETKRDRIIVVVSAMQGITNQLLQGAHAAAAGDTQYEQIHAAIARRHRDTLRDLHGKRVPKATLSAVNDLLRELRDVLHGMYLLRHCPLRALDLAASFGERLSALLLVSFLNRVCPVQYVDAREFIVTDDHFTQANVLFDQTNRKIRSYFRKLSDGKKSSVVSVVTGFIASTEDGRTTTIGRNGSDYTAAIVGATLGASVIEIWTDVDGVFSADPRSVPSAFVLSRLSYEEAMELSYFGATVLHSATIAPAVAKNIPILIKNTLNPKAPGTLISKKTDAREGVAKGITAVDGITLFTLRGMSMVGVPGTAERLFGTLAAHHVNVILISQASSEHTICFAVSTKDATAARKAIAHEFRHELQDNLTSLDEKISQTVVAIVGEGMKGTPGVAGKIFQSLGRNSININAIAQGASEYNISFVIDSAQRTRTLNVVHQSFFEKRKRVSLVVVGIGNIGSALLKQVHQQQGFLLSKGFDVRVCGISNSKRFIVNGDGLDLERWQEELQHSTHRADPRQLVHQIAKLELTNVALVDCTASSDIVDVYPEFVDANMHIITPNKKANVLPWKKYQSLMELMKKRQKHFLYEANVGAGLPVISTLQDLIASGDSVVKIEGIFSGTLSYLFNTFDGKKPFSALVKEALDRGFTEPDPREDLSGSDVARKLLILARQIGWKMDIADIRVHNLVPAALREKAFSEKFFSRYAAYDQHMNNRIERAQSRGNVLRYVGTLTNKKASATLQEVPAHHPLASAKGSDNIIAFTTHRYSHTPLLFQGPGAGADVTAMGVFSDILKLLHYLSN